jgi:hypothetical protein
MNSAERRLARYQRRQKTRQAKRELYAKPFDDYGVVADADNLCRAFRKAKRGVSWKESVQRFEASLLSNIAALWRKLLAGDSIQSGFVEFTLRERGKVRHIKSVHISERVVQKVLSDEVLTPVLSKPLIYDNGASIKGKGVHFALRRLICHLSRYYRRNKTNEGYAFLLDFKKFFDNIDHGLLFGLIDRRIRDARIRELVRRFVLVFGAGKSLGLGSQISQISAIYYPDKLDHFVKEKLRIKYYRCYMDDMYLIHADKSYLQYCFAEIKKVCAELKITISEKKSRIVKLKDGVVFLKEKYALLESGKVLRIPCKGGALRMCRKLKKFKPLIAAGKMNYADLRTACQSWRGNFRKRFNAHYCILHTGSLYNKLFIQRHKAAVEGNDVLSGKEKRQGLRRKKP